eukprot:scaffold244893_cov48-Prasinocladus_malaysianus.AAC.1
MNTDTIQSDAMWRALQAAAVILEPLEEDALVVIDGELFPTGPVYLEVHNNLLSVLVDPEIS